MATVDLAGDSVIPAARVKEINIALGKIIRCRSTLDRAEKCGYEGSQDRAALDAFEAMFNAWKREFFPMQP